MAIAQTLVTGIIFRMFNAQESDKVVHILAADGSRISCVAKGVRKQTSRKAHAVDLLNLVEVKLNQLGELPMVNEIKLVEQANQFKLTYPDLILSQFICELINLSVHEAEAEVGFYRNVKALVEVKKVTRPLMLASALMLRFLYVGGHLPPLGQDVGSGEKLGASGAWFLPEGGYSTDEVANADFVPARLIKTQHFMLENTFAQAQNVALSPEEQVQLFQIHVQWTQAALQAELKSAKILLEAVKIAV